MASVGWRDARGAVSPSTIGGIAAALPSVAVAAACPAQGGSGLRALRTQSSQDGKRERAQW